MFSLLTNRWENQDIHLCSFLFHHLVKYVQSKDNSFFSFFDEYNQFFITLFFVLLIYLIVSWITCSIFLLFNVLLLDLYVCVLKFFALIINSFILYHIQEGKIHTYIYIFILFYFSTDSFGKKFRKFFF